MRMLVIGSCTKSKLDFDCPPAIRLSEADFADQFRLRRRQQELQRWLRPAGEMYTGRQHTQNDGWRWPSPRPCLPVMVLFPKRPSIAALRHHFPRDGQALYLRQGEMLGISGCSAQHLARLRLCLRAPWRRVSAQYSPATLKRFAFLIQVLLLFFSGLMCVFEGPIGQGNPGTGKHKRKYR